MTKALKHHAPSVATTAETAPATLRGPWSAGEADAARTSPARLLQSSLEDALAVREGPRFSGPARLTIIVGGALASWAAVLGSAGLLLAR